MKPNNRSDSRTRKLFTLVSGGLSRRLAIAVMVMGLLSGFSVAAQGLCKSGPLGKKTTIQHVSFRVFF